MDSKHKLKQALNTKDISVTEFTKEMTFVVNSMHARNKKDEDITEIRDGYMIAKKENPECIIMQAGPYFWKYRETIKEGNANALLKNDFKDEITEVQGTLPDYSGFDKVQPVMNKIKRTWNLLTPIEQDIMKKKFNKMVAHYATYVGACKHIRELQEKTIQEFDHNYSPLEL